MALIKKTETSLGSALPATYHRILKAEVYYREGVVDVTLGGYLNREQRDDSVEIETEDGVKSYPAQPICTVDVRVAFTGKDPTRTEIYNAIVANPDLGFADAEAA
jgi:hypothetical protein